MGSRKLLVFFLCSALCVFLLSSFASAEEIAEREVLGSPLTKDISLRISSRSSDTSRPLFKNEVYYRYEMAHRYPSAFFQESDSVLGFQLDIYDYGGNLLKSFSSSDEVPIYVTVGDSAVWHFGDETWTDVYNRLGIYSLFSLNGNYSKSNVTRTEVVIEATLGFFSGIVSSLYSVGGQVIAFVISHWVVALPLIAFVLVICISVIRRIVKGV